MLDLGLRRPLKWTFCVADVTTPIIRADFLYHFDLIVDLPRGRLHDNVTGLDTKGRLTSKPHASIVTTRPQSIYHELLRGFPGITKPSAPFCERSHHVFHHIDSWTSGCSAMSSFAPGEIKICHVYARGGYLQTIEKPMGRSVAHGAEEESWNMETMRRLSKIKCRHSAR